MKAKTKTKKIKSDARPPTEIFPKVSVLLTSYNHAAYVAAAIESVLNQTFTDFELLIVDDGSRDNSREIIKTFNDTRIKLFLYDENRGPTVAIRDALSSARGKYIAVHHSDDLWTPDKLARQVDFLETNPNCAACFTWADFVDEAGNIRELEETDFYRNIFDQPNRTRAEWLNYFFYNANCLCHPSAMIRRDAYEKFHLLDVHGFWQLPDLLMWVRLCFNAEIFILPERLTQFRLRRTRQENMSATTADKSVRLDLEFFFLAQEYIYNFTNNKFFLEVFPEANKFLVNGQMNRRFAFAQLCFERKTNVATAAFDLAGLMILKNLLNSPENAAQIFELYGYDDKSFLRDGGYFDVFNLAQKFDMLHAEVFVGCDNFKRVAEKVISVEQNGKFYVRIDFELSERATYLRLDPDRKFISVRLNSVLINGEPCEISAHNAGETVDGFYRFWTNDPQFFFRREVSGHVTFEIFGERENNFSDNLLQNFVNLVEERKNLFENNDELRRLNAELNQQNDELRSHNAELNQQNAELRSHNAELNQQNAELRSHNAELNRQNDELNRQNAELHRHNTELNRQNAELRRLNDEVLKSNSWRMTEPFRALRRWINYGKRR